MDGTVATRPPEPGHAADRSRPPRVGLVLGAGAFRGGAHVGVIRVLEREGIPIDLVVGTSGGALPAMMYCAGFSVDFMDEGLRRLKTEDVFSPSVGRDGFTDMRPLCATLEKLVGTGREFASLPRRFTCVAADALTGEPVVMSHGSVVSAVEASMAIPGLVRPVQRDGRSLVDGSVVQPVPVSVARSMGAGFVIAIDVHVPRFGSRVCLHPGEAQNHCFDMAIQRLCEIELQHADVVIRPELRPFGPGLEWGADFIAAGERAGAQAAPRIRAQWLQFAARD
jgi:predicted acylesterase/phospholipase RssA